MRPVRILVAATVLAVPVIAAAQTRPAPQGLPRPAPDFLFEPPDGSLTIRGSWFLARAGSDWYDFVTRQLTLDDSDFNSAGVGVDVGIVITPRLEAIVGFDFSQSTTPSEYRDFVDSNRLPIEQRTRLRQIGLSGALKVALARRGREVGRFAWVPSRVVPYAGAGGGILWYNVLQSGDFVDFVDRSIFTDAFLARGATPSVHVFGGVDVRVARRLFVTFDGRYLWAAGDLGREWIDFDPIDLGGTRLSAGLNLVF